MKTRQWNVYLNGEWIDKIGGNKPDLKSWLNRNLRSTHMGGWIKTRFGYEYTTTIGRYYLFKEVRNET